MYPAMTEHGFGPALTPFSHGVGSVYVAHVMCVALQVPTKIAVSIKQVPAKVAFGVKALADGDDNKDAIVSDIFPKPAAEQQA